MTSCMVTVNHPRHDELHGDSEPLCGTMIPLNLRRLKSVFLKKLAVSMELPTSGSADQLQQQIDWKLSVDEENPFIQWCLFRK